MDGSPHFLLFLLVSCAASGPVFQPIRDMPPDKGVLYLYRPTSFIGAALDFYIKVDGEPVGAVGNGSYLPLTLNPGLHVISLSGVSGYILFAPLDINIDAGGSHYVQVVSTMKYGVITAEFQGMDEQAARGEISVLHLAR